MLRHSLRWRCRKFGEAAQIGGSDQMRETRNIVHMFSTGGKVNVIIVRGRTG